MLSKPEVIAALAALAHPARLDVFRALVQAGPSGITPTVLATALGTEVKQSTLATYLKELANAGLVVSQRDGRSVLYQASYAHMNAVLAFLTQNCCQGTPTPAGAETSGSCPC
jgi:ArsR family transcriptional regulator